MSGTTPISESNPRLSRGIIVDWYDGAVAGAVECDLGSRSVVFAFHMVAWDVEQSKRIFVLRPLADSAISDLTRILTDAGEPSLPWWAPVHFSTPERRDTAWKRTSALLDNAGPAEYLVSAADLTGAIEEVVQIKDETIRAQVSSMVRSATDAPDDFVYSTASYTEWSAVCRRLTKAF